MQKGINGKDTIYTHFSSRAASEVAVEDFNVTGAHMSVDVSTRFAHYACIVVVAQLSCPRAPWATFARIVS